MKLPYSLHSSVMTTLAAFLTALCSCTSNDMLDMIPADADYVTTVDIQNVIEKSGIEITETDIKGPADLKTEINSIPTDIRDAVIKLNRAIDARRIVMFGYAAVQSGIPECYAFAKVTDLPSLKELLGQTGAKMSLKADGFETYQLENIIFLEKDSFLWLVPSRDPQEAVSRIKKVLDRADEKNITSNTRVCDLLAEKNVLNAVVNLDPFIDLVSKYGYQMMDTQEAIIAASALPKLKGNWMSASISYNGTGVEFIAKIFNPETGENLKLPIVKKINATALENIPDNSIIAGAIGIDNENLCAMLDAIKPMIDRDPMATMAISHLRKIDGTVGFALGVDNLMSLLSGYNERDNTYVTAFIEAQDGTASEVKEFFQNALSTAPGMQIRADKNFIIFSTAPDQKSGHSKLMDIMNDKEIAYAGEITSFSELTNGRSDIGAKASATFKDGELKLNFDLTNVKGSAIAEFIKLTTSIEESVNSYYYEKHYSSPGY